MTTIIDKSFAENTTLLEYLNVHSEMSLAQLVEDSFRKTLVLAAASYFENQITDAIHNYCVWRTSSDACIISMVRMKVLSRQYHTFFDWEAKTAGTFFRLLGDSIGNELKKDARVDPLKESLAAFLELGYLRNCLVHQNFASYVFDKTTKEVYELYIKAAKFVDCVVEKLLEGSSSAELEGKIRERAYEIYMIRDGQDGHAEDDWLQAEADILGNIRDA